MVRLLRYRSLMSRRRKPFNQVQIIKESRFIWSGFVIFFRRFPEMNLLINADFCVSIQLLTIVHY